VTCFPRRAARGFTLTELVVVIVVATILSAFAISKINSTSFDNEGFANQAGAMVRYAQKIAISQRRVVFVVISSSQIRLCYADSACGTPLQEPPGTNPFAKTVKSPVSLSGTTFSFDPLGRPSAGGVITVSDGTPADTQTITVEAETGYVH
jgi:MSHA pilin protein MshC